MIKNISLITVAMVLLVGCGGGSGSSDSGKAATLADAKKLAKNLGSGTEIGSGLGAMGNGAKSQVKTRDVLAIPCKSGAANILFDKKNIIIEADNNFSMDMTLETVNCVDEDDGTIMNGTMNFKITDTSMLISFPTEFTFKDGTKSSKVFKGGSMKIEEKDPYEVMTINMKVIDGTETYGGKNLVYYTKENSDGSSEFFPKSGQEDIGTGVYFTVDPNYDASQTPMVTDMNDKLQIGGLFKYLDGKNHKIQLEATAVDKLTISVDENGNGTFEASEVETIDAQ